MVEINRKIISIDSEIFKYVISHIISNDQFDRTGISIASAPILGNDRVYGSVSRILSELEKNGAIAYATDENDKKIKKTYNKEEVFAHPFVSKGFVLNYSKRPGVKSVKAAQLRKTEAWDDLMELYRDKAKETKKKKENSKAVIKPPGTHTKEEWNKKCLEFDDLCAYCVDGNIQAKDHFVPKTHKDCTNNIDNLIPSCTSCNSSKSDTNFALWYSWKIRNDLSFIPTDWALDLLGNLNVAPVMGDDDKSREYRIEKNISAIEVGRTRITKYNSIGSVIGRFFSKFF